MNVNCLNGSTTTEAKKKKEKESIGILLLGYHYLYTKPCCENIAWVLILRPISTLKLYHMNSIVIKPEN